MNAKRTIPAANPPAARQHQLQLHQAVAHQPAIVLVVTRFSIHFSGVQQDRAFYHLAATPGSTTYLEAAALRHKAQPEESATHGWKKCSEMMPRHRYVARTLTQ